MSELPSAEIAMPVTVYECPLAACPWKHADVPPSGTTVIASDDDIWRVIRDRLMAAEEVIRTHLETHPLLEWATEVMRLRSQAAGTVIVNRDDLAEVHGYARHFDVDSDPSMVKVAAALGSFIRRSR